MAECRDDLDHRRSKTNAEDHEPQNTFETALQTAGKAPVLFLNIPADPSRNSASYGFLFVHR